MHTASGKVCGGILAPSGEHRYGFRSFRSAMKSPLLTGGRSFCGKKNDVFAFLSCIVLELLILLQLIYCRI